MLEAAWNVAQLHFDQTQKKEALDGVRRHKGDPLCGMAIVGQIRRFTLARPSPRTADKRGRYLLENTKTTRLVNGGLGPTIMEAYESDIRHHQWRTNMRRRNATIATDQPRYLEPFLLRWFGQAYWDLFLDVALVAGRQAGSRFQMCCFKGSPRTAPSKKANSSRAPQPYYSPRHRGLRCDQREKRPMSRSTSWCDMSKIR